MEGGQEGGARSPPFEEGRRVCNARTRTAGSMPFGRFGESRIASFLLPGCFCPPLPLAPNHPGSLSPDQSLLSDGPSVRSTDHPTVTRRVKGLLKRMAPPGAPFAPPPKPPPHPRFRARCAAHETAGANDVIAEKKRTHFVTFFPVGGWGVEEVNRKMSYN